MRVLIARLVSLVPFPCDSRAMFIVARGVGWDKWRGSHGGAVVLAGVVHGREVSAWNERDFVTVAMVIVGEKFAPLLVFLARVFQSQPTDGPGHFALWAAACKSLAAGADSFGAIVDGLIFAKVARWSDLDLIYAENGNVGKKPAA